MKITTKQTNAKKIKTNILVVGVFEDNKLLSPLAKELDTELDKLISDYLTKKQQFAGKFLETFLLPTYKQFGADNILAVGLGRVDDFDIVKLREVGAKIYSTANSIQNNAHVSVDTIGLDKMLYPPFEFAKNLTEAIILSSFSFNKYKNKKQDSTISTIEIISSGSNILPDLQEGVKIGSIYANSQNFARTLATEPAENATPTKIAKVAKSLAENNPNISCTVYNKTEIEKLKMNAFLAVGKGSNEEPRFIHLKYMPKSPRKKVALIGKGITFDSGGLDIKPPASMLNMKDDMSGCAIALGVFNAITKLEPDVELHVLSGLCENMPSGKSYKPGDVLKAKNGLTIEVDNTDAEGRITLADVLCYADELGVDEIIDIATLTGACVVALGNNISAVMGRNQDNINKIIKIGAQSGEFLWQLPVYDFMQDALKSDIADMKNTGSRFAGASNAAQFLSNFVNNPNWLHIDIAGTAFVDKPFKELPKGATGVCTRTLISYILS